MGARGASVNCFEWQVMRHEIEKKKVRAEWQKTAEKAYVPRSINSMAERRVTAKVRTWRQVERQKKGTYQVAEQRGRKKARIPLLVLYRRLLAR